MKVNSTFNTKHDRIPKWNYDRSRAMSLFPVAIEVYRERIYSYLVIFVHETFIHRNS